MSKFKFQVGDRVRVIAVFAPEMSRYQDKIGTVVKVEKRTYPYRVAKFEGYEEHIMYSGSQFGEDELELVR